MEPSAAAPVHQRISIGDRDDAEQTVRHRARDTDELLLLGVTAPLRSLSRPRASIRGLEEGVGRQSHQYRRVPTFETGQVGLIFH